MLRKGRIQTRHAGLSSKPADGLKNAPSWWGCEIQTNAGGKRRSWNDWRRGGAIEVNIGAVELELGSRRANLARIAFFSSKGYRACVKLQALGFDDNAELINVAKIREWRGEAAFELEAACDVGSDTCSLEQADLNSRSEVSFCAIEGRQKACDLRERAIHISFHSASQLQ